jgi:hypothetical protein
MLIYEGIGKMKKSSKIITATLGIIWIILTAILIGTIIQFDSTIQVQKLTINNQTETIDQYNSTIEVQELTIYNQTEKIDQYISTIQENEQIKDNLNQQIKEKNEEISELNLSITNKTSQIKNITNQKDQIQIWLNNNITTYEEQIDIMQNQNLTNQQTIVELQNQNLTNQQIINTQQNQLNTSNQLIYTLTVEKTELENRTDKLESVLTFNNSDLQTLAFHIVGEKEDWINNTDINHIYNELSTRNNDTYEIIIFPEFREHQNFTAELEWLNNDFMGKQGIPIMLEAFSGSEENLSITKLSLENITTALTTNNIKYLRIAEVISWYMENNENFPEDYVRSMLNFSRTNNLQIFWTEWKTDYLPIAPVFTKIQTLIEGYEDIVTVSFSTNSGEAEPFSGFLDLDEKFQHWGASIQPWYWDTRYDEDLQNMPISLLTLHALAVKSAGAEIIQFEPYWYFFNHETGEITENLELLFTMLK